MPPVPLRVALMLALMALPSSSWAQVGGGASADVLAGVEGGARGYAAGIRRSRTALRLGFSGWLESAPASALSLAALIEMEPAAALGADLRYEHRFAEVVVLHLGLSSILLPETLLGVSTGFTYQPAIGEHFSLALGPTMNVYFWGSDLPPEVPVLLQGVVGMGARVWF